MAGNRKVWQGPCETRSSKDILGILPSVQGSRHGQHARRTGRTSGSARGSRGVVSGEVLSPAPDAPDRGLQVSGRFAVWSVCLGAGRWRLPANYPKGSSSRRSDKAERDSSQRKRLPLPSAQRKAQAVKEISATAGASL